MRHEPTVRIAGSRYEGACSCGWGANRCRPKENLALDDASAHAKRQTVQCRKVKFHTEAAPLDAVVRAKIAAALHSNKKRREQRAYECGDCGGWHITSQPRKAPIGAITKALKAGAPVTQIMDDLDVDYATVKEIRDQMAAAS